MDEREGAGACVDRRRAVHACALCTERVGKGSGRARGSERKKGRRAAERGGASEGRRPGSGCGHGARGSGHPLRPSQGARERRAPVEEAREPQRSPPLQQHQVTRPPPPRGAGLGRGPGGTCWSFPSVSGPRVRAGAAARWLCMTLAGGASVSSSVTHGALPLPPRGCCERGDAVPVRRALGQVVSPLPTWAWICEVHLR